MRPIEAVARAICREEYILRYGTANWWPGELDQKVDEYWSKHIRAAIAAIEAIREPTEVMIDAANELPVTEHLGYLVSQSMYGPGYHEPLPMPPNSPLQQWWRAMVDQAIAEGPED